MENNQQQPNGGGALGQVSPVPGPGAASILKARGQAREETGAASDSERKVLERINPAAGGPAPQIAPVGETPATAAPSQAEKPVSLTGGETDEQLKELGYNRPETYERIRNLAKARNESRDQLTATQEENERLRQQLAMQPQAPVQPAAPVGELPAEFQLEEFSEAFPEDGTMAEQDEWRMRKIADEVSQKNAAKANIKLANAFGGVLGPMVQERAMAEHEASWDSIKDGLDQIGTSREEIEPYVKDILAKQPDRSVEDAAFQVLRLATGQNPWELMKGARNAAPAAPPMATPGAGRTLPPGQYAPSQPSAAEQLGQLQENVRKSAEVGDTAGVRRGVAQIFRTRGSVHRAT